MFGYKLNTFSVRAPLESHYKISLWKKCKRWYFLRVLILNSDPDTVQYHLSSSTKFTLAIFFLTNFASQFSTCHLLILWKSDTSIYILGLCTVLVNFCRDAGHPSFLAWFLKSVLKLYLQAYSSQNGQMKLHVCHTVKTNFFLPMWYVCSLLASSCYINGCQNKHTRPFFLMAGGSSPFYFCTSALQPELWFKIMLSAVISVLEQRTLNLKDNIHFVP